MVVWVNGVIPKVCLNIANDAKLCSIVLLLIASEPGFGNKLFVFNPINHGLFHKR